MLRPLAALLLSASLLHAQWGRDVNPGMGEQLLVSVQDDLVEIVGAPAADRPGLVDAFVKTHGETRIEAIKRFRNPELKDLFFELLAHDDWHIRHRALLVLEYYGDTAVVDHAWQMLKAPQPRLREKAAITCIKLWDGRVPLGDIKALIANEGDPHVRSCLETLARRLKDKQHVHRVHEEFVRTYKNGLMAVPFLNGMNELKQRAPGYVRKTEHRQGKGNATKMKPAPRWIHPLLGWGAEEVKGVTLQPFANLRQMGRIYHTGHDVGACLEGAGFYAAAAGIVKLVSSGSDMGTLLVVQHHVTGGELVNAVYMHGGDTVFVKPGEKVAAGQLLGTMGLGFSIENGGHYAHLHYGLYPGPFSMTHNYGYKPRKDGLADWYDPAVFLEQWIAQTAPVMGRRRELDRSLKQVEKLVDKGHFGKAYEAAVKARDKAEPGEDDHVDAVYLIGLLDQVPPNVLERATKLMEAGYPRAARDQLNDFAYRCKGMPGAEEFTKTLARWEGDTLFHKALKGDKRIEITMKRAAKEKDPAKVRTMWRKLLHEYRDTCLKARIEERIR